MANIELQTEFNESQGDINAALEQLASDNIVARIWEKDHTVWKPDPAEITNRLGWLDVFSRLKPEISRMLALRQDFLATGFTHALLLGMGGSSLAPEVFSRTFGSDHQGLELSVLDSTDPAAVELASQKNDPAHTVFIVSTKSGGTVETLSFFKYFYNRVLDAVGADQAGQHFIAITDPGSKLEALAKEFNFRTTFLNDPNIGGRFSALSFFGLVPAALVGVDVNQLISRAEEMASVCGSAQPIGQNPGALTGLVIGKLAKSGKDKLTFITSPKIAAFGDWVEQLIAESTGKEGVGILPVVGEPLGGPEVYGADRVFVYLHLAGDDSLTIGLDALEAAGHPILRFDLPDRYALGGQYFLWEFATAVAGYVLKINPFDQPNVESAKVLAREMVAAFHDTGVLPERAAFPLSKNRLAAFLSGAKPGNYFAIQAYVTPTREAQVALSNFQTALRNKYHIATTLGFGPRFLHSTGQLHKGDRGNGLFIQIISQSKTDLPIPDQPGSEESSMSFQTLKMSQALGDAAALEAENRQIISFTVENPADIQANI